MIYTKTVIAIITISTFFNTTCAQNQDTDNWSTDEKTMYQNLKNLAYYIADKDSTEISKDTLFERYIEMEYVLIDTDEARKSDRLIKFDGLFAPLKKTVNSLGVDNLDAKPIRYFKQHKIYKPFLKNLKGLTPYVMAYYKKSDPENPLGTLLFEQDSKKLLAWILMLSDEDSHGFYLRLNLF